ncbi:hypothetical protein OG728_02175 [Streptomyces microflavus]|uniref:hypothetical protein n=1 Tax=Streptomyces microflavus TaxID=1919 RepID=UPI002E0EB331|nr:hypothetical protein OG728_02175 [Streptomyces microflavus]
MTTEVQAAAERDLHDRLREPEENVADGRQALEELRARGWPPSPRRWRPDFWAVRRERTHALR